MRTTGNGSRASMPSGIEIIHGKALGKPLTLFQLSDKNIDYVLRTGFYFLLLINFKYGLWFDLAALVPGRA